MIKINGKVDKPTLTTDSAWYFVLYSKDSDGDVLFRINNEIS